MFIFIIIILISGCEIDNNLNDKDIPDSAFEVVETEVESEENVEVIEVFSRFELSQDFKEIGTNSNARVGLIPRNLRQIGVCYGSKGDYYPRYVDDRDREYKTLDVSEGNNIYKFKVFCDQNNYIGEFLLFVNNDLPEDYLRLALGLSAKTMEPVEDVEIFWAKFFYEYFKSSSDIRTWASINAYPHRSVNSNGYNFLNNLMLNYIVSKEITCNMNAEKVNTSILPGSEPELIIKFKCSDSSRDSSIGLTTSYSVEFIYSETPPLIEIVESKSDYCSPSLDNCRDLIKPSRKSDKLQITDGNLPIGFLKYLNPSGSLSRPSIFGRHVVKSYLSAYYSDINKPVINYWDLMWENRNRLSHTGTSVTVDNELKFLTRTEDEMTTNRYLIMNNLDRTITLNMGGTDSNFDELREYIKLDFKDYSLIYENLDDDLIFISKLESGFLGSVIVYSETNLDQTGIEVLVRDYLNPFRTIIIRMMNQSGREYKMNFPSDLAFYNDDWIAREVNNSPSHLKYRGVQ